MQALAADNPMLIPGGQRRTVELLRQYLPLTERIESFWRDPRSQQARSWLEHRDINTVMLATSLFPDEFLAIA